MFQSELVDIDTVLLRVGLVGSSSGTTVGVLPMPGSGTGLVEGRGLAMDAMSDMLTTTLLPVPMLGRPSRLAAVRRRWLVLLLAASLFLRFLGRLGPMRISSSQ